MIAMHKPTWMHNDQLDTAHDPGHEVSSNFLHKLRCSLLFAERSELPPSNLPKTDP